VRSLVSSGETEPRTDASADLSPVNRVSAGQLSRDWIGDPVFRLIGCAGIFVSTCVGAGGLADGRGVDGDQGRR